MVALHWKKDTFVYLIGRGASHHNSSLGIQLYLKEYYVQKNIRFPFQGAMSKFWMFSHDKKAIFFWEVKYFSYIAGEVRVQQGEMPQICESVDLILSGKNDKKKNSSQWSPESKASIPEC